MTIRSHQLTSQQLHDLDLLADDCKKTDGNSIAIYKYLLGHKRPSSCSLLYYQEKRLVAFLSTFFFYTDACEVAVMVAPEYRNQGISTQLIREILPDLQTKTIKRIIFSTAYGLNNHWLTAKGFVYLNSEYQMLRNSNELVAADNKSLVFKQASLDDIASLCAIDLACFPAKQKDMSARFLTLVNDSNYTLFLAFKDEVAIGKAHICWQEESTRFADIAITPRLQGRGFGNALLAYCINYALSISPLPITLDVETNNQNALRLYTRLGFEVSNAYDFWSIELDRLDLTEF